MLFTEMGLSDEILMGIKELGFESPTPIQEKVIPVLINDRCDIVGLAQTGTGKTAAFGLPLLENISLKQVYPQMLVLSPTRELCMQITRDLENYSKFMSGLNIVAVYGGASIEKQINDIRRGVHVVVATPGRICDLLRRNKLDLSKINSLVLDEADEMLKMGFREDVDAVLASTPREKNTLLFSATMSDDIAAIARTYMNDPLEVTIGKKNEGAENVNHIYHMVHAKDRYAALKRVVDYFPDVYAIVFCRTRQDTKEVAASLMKDGYDAEALHGDLTQAQRDYVMQKFRDRNLRLLVATDVAARGLDVNDLTHVINYNLPDDSENYTHRSGRTGRAGKDGTSISIINLKEFGKIREIERVIHKKFEQKPVPGGKEICERQLFSMVNRMNTIEVNYEQIDPFMNSVSELFKELSKEEIIKRFVSVEFNRFLDYYKNAPDLNADVRSGKGDRYERGDRSERRDHNGRDRDRGERSDRGGERRERRTSDRPMSRVIINIGKGKELSKKEVIELMISASGKKDVEIGQIEIYKRASSVEVDKKLSSKVINELNRRFYKGIKLEAEENFEFHGNDYRDRDKGPRGKRRDGKKRYE
ncbi:MAG TPA: DEAD/DEAH box helicase [Prolixibacteraceae bacterium]|nr:DEAD/DEAH box helicase [Prolixibacteraceae bacterium]